MTGFVYFISVPGRVKVGFTTRPDSRIREIARHTEQAPMLIGTIAGSIPLERAIHARLSSYRIRGEWFDDCDDVRSVIARLLHDGPSAIGFARPERSKSFSRPPTPDRPSHEILRDIGRRVFPDDPCGGLADAFGVPREQCDAWLGGEQLPPVYVSALGGLLIQWMQPRS